MALSIYDPIREQHGRARGEERQRLPPWCSGIGSSRPRRGRYLADRECAYDRRASRSHRRGRCRSRDRNGVLDRSAGMRHCAARRDRSTLVDAAATQLAGALDVRRMRCRVHLLRPHGNRVSLGLARATRASLIAGRDTDDHRVGTMRGTEREHSGVRSEPAGAGPNGSNGVAAPFNSLEQLTEAA